LRLAPTALLCPSNLKSVAKQYILQCCIQTSTDSPDSIYYLVCCAFISRDLKALFPSSAAPYLDAVESNRLAWGFVDEALERRGRCGVSTGSVRDIFRDGSVEREVTEKEAKSRDKDAIRQYRQ
jgi:hypothetical protein